jgi:phage terminase large subunit-like protein
MAKKRKVDSWVDEDLAGMLPEFFRSLRQCKGEHAGKGLELQDWQFNQVVKPLFCTMRPDGLRQYRQAFLALPRKAGKTTLAAAIALYLLLADDEQGGEIVSAAADASAGIDLF